jgi:PKD repeat protein
MEENTKKFLVVIEVAILIIAAIIVGIVIMDKTDVISISNDPPIATAYADVTSGKIPLEVTFTGIGEDENGIKSYKWEFGDGAFSDQQYPTHTYRKEGKYSVYLTVEDKHGNTARDNIIIDAFENKPPTAKIVASDDWGYPPIKVNFKGEGTDEDGEIVSYRWEFHDESTDLQNPTKIFWMVGTYTVKLTVTDDDGATGTDIKEIEAREHMLLSLAKLYLSWKIFKWIISL